MTGHKEKIKQVNEILQKGEPGNISTDDHGSQIYSGYKPQSVVDAMNEAFDYGEWGFEEELNEIKTGDKGVPFLAVAKVHVWLKGVEFKPKGWGQNRVTRGDEGDARKGAQTDAIKKALSYFSIGSRAYLGLLPVSEDKQNNTSQSNYNGQQRPTQQKSQQGYTQNASKQPRSEAENSSSNHRNLGTDEQENGSKSQHNAKNRAVPTQLTSTINAPLPGSLHKRCDSLFGPGKWEAVKARILGSAIVDDNLTPEDCSKVKRNFDGVEEQRKAKAS